ncbi:MAG: DNA polymerase III subunit alpha, partial [Anaerolineales bacterium]|nr:DNA polymerase III subunit alpha [Anaerolineales bacterium]
GSIVAYCLGITLVDPIEHGLIFERFLNPGRVSMPDIDLDFQDDLRYKLLEYTSNKYGRDKVAQIITFGTLGARAAIRDVGRVLDIPLPDVDRVAKMIPAIPGKPVSIPEALESVQALREVYDGLPYFRELIDTAARLEGVARNAGTHAAGVIITDTPIVEHIPLHRPTGGTQEGNPIGAVTQYDLNVLESLGFLKIDFLGLSTLTVMARACQLIKEHHGVELDIRSIPLDDQETYKLLGNGNVLGVFQVEGAGMRRFLMDMKPCELANVVAMVALYRPGPLEKIPDYIRRMHGQEEVTYLHPALAPILEETYGITVYQEQIMYTAMNLAGYSASEADNLRKAVAKKRADALQQQRKKFVSGAVQGGIPQSTASAIFDEWETFARYGFPKGHAADYAVICVQTAYLKAHYPLEYMTALLSVFKHDNDKVAIYIADCRRMGLDALSPDINASGLDFEIEDRLDRPAGIRFGLGAVKNVGESAVETILKARREGDPFESLEDFARRVDLRHVGKRALESLVKVGALDCLGSRMAMLDSLERILALSSTHFRAIDVGQMSFFGASTGISDDLAVSPVISEAPRRRQLGWEKELLGVYVSDHPLTPHVEELARVVTHFSAELGDATQGQKVCVAGEICHIRPYQTKNGKDMGFVTLEDLQGMIELVVFNRIWSDVAKWLQPEMIVLVKGKVDTERGDPKVLVDMITADLKMVQPTKTAPPAPEVEDPPTIPYGEPEPMQPGYEVPDLSPQMEEEYWGTTPAVEHVVKRVKEADTPIETSLSPKPGKPQSSPIAVIDEEQLGSQASEGAPVPGKGSTLPPLLSPEPTEISPLMSLARELSGRTDPQMVIVILKSTGDRRRDALRMRRVHGLLTSYPGRDRFAFHVFETSRRYHLEFPSSTTGYCPELHAQLLTLLGEGSVRVEPLMIQ